MAGKYATRIAELDNAAREFKALSPDTTVAFGGMCRAAQTAGSLDRKTKELIALAISVAGQCEGCVAYHARAVHRAGANRQQVGEMLSVVVQMGGGPSYYAAAEALAAFDEFANAAIAPHRHGVE